MVCRCLEWRRSTRAVSGMAHGQHGRSTCIATATLHFIIRRLEGGHACSNCSILLGGGGDGTSTTSTERWRRSNQLMLAVSEAAFGNQPSFSHTQTPAI